MISKEDLRKRLEEGLKTVKVGDLTAVSQLMSNHLKFAVENYDNLTPDAKEMTDKSLETIQDYVGELVEKIPDSKEKRIIERLYASSKGEHYKVDQIIKALEAPPEPTPDELSEEFRRIFVARLQNIIDFLYDVSENTFSGSVGFGQLGLLGMCIDELLVTLHLTQHGYINQAYSHIRTVHEHLDKIELFRTKPEWFKVWCSKDDEKIRKELSPAGVRKKIGKERYDPKYSFFSELGPHGTFKAVQMKLSKGVGPSSKGNPKISIWYGGSPFKDYMVALNTSALFAVYSVLVEIMKSFSDFINEDELKDILKESEGEIKRYAKNLLTWAKDKRLDWKELEDFLAE